MPLPTPAGGLRRSSLAPSRRPHAVRRTALAAAVALSASGLLACGGGGDGPSRIEVFKGAYDRQRKELNVVTARIGVVLNTADGKTNAQVAADVRGVEKQFRAGIDELAALEPPEELVPDFDRLTRIARELDGDLVRIGDAAANDDPEAARDAALALSARAPKLTPPATRIAKALGLPPAENGPGARTDTTATGAGAAGTATTGATAAPAP
ncbi:hypothetical protein AB0L40_14115 [Patulibacter sp. NPDC049589]|uniref:hypothetical protein n=1 Tax=Patulibacter sp. NPDC049589 TaxID=3154731 RepID=UPI00343514A6